MVELKVAGMTCNHCVSAIKQAVRSIDSNARINVDLVAHRVWVESDAGMEEITAAVTDAGYDVSESKRV